MGIDWAPLYGELELGSAVEHAEEVISKIKTNKFDKEEIAKELEQVLVEIKNAL